MLPAPTLVVEDADAIQKARICLYGDVADDGKKTANDHNRLLAHVKKYPCFGKGFH